MFNQIQNLVEYGINKNNMYNHSCGMHGGSNRADEESATTGGGGGDN